MIYLHYQKNKLINELLDINNDDLYMHLTSIIRDLELHNNFASIFNDTTDTTIPQDFFQLISDGENRKLKIDPNTGVWDDRINANDMHFIDTQTFLRRFIKIILTINCFNQIVKYRKNKAYDNYKALLEDIMMANNLCNLCNFS